MHIRKASKSDFKSMWPIFQAVVSTGSTYSFAPDTDQLTAFDYWFGDGVTSYVVGEDDSVRGMYRIIANQRDQGSHVATAAFMVNPAGSGRGIGKSMGVHCLKEAKKMGYKAMQFNFVVSTNDGAVSLWKKLGFVVVGQLPKAFLHKELGFVDAYVMHRFLDDIEVS